MFLYSFECLKRLVGSIHSYIHIETYTYTYTCNNYLHINLLFYPLKKYFVLQIRRGYDALGIYLRNESSIQEIKLKIYIIFLFSEMAWTKVLIQSNMQSSFQNFRNTIIWTIFKLVNQNNDVRHFQYQQYHYMNFENDLQHMFRKTAWIKVQHQVKNAHEYSKFDNFENYHFERLVFEKPP